MSGGLDSSITCAVATRFSKRPLETFSISFEDPSLDETGYQATVVGDVGSIHHVQPVSGPEIGEAFRDVLRHAETPMVRTAPVPLFLVSRLTRDHGIRVVPTCKGADEVFLGYDLFKETRLRRFCLRQSGSTSRPRLFDRIDPYLDDGGRQGEFWRRFFQSAGPQRILCSRTSPGS